MTTSNDLYKQVKPDIEAIADPLFDYSEPCIRRRGNFLPHSALLTKEEKLNLSQLHLKLQNKFEAVKFKVFEKAKHSVELYQLSYKLHFLLIIVVIAFFSCSSPNENDLPLTSLETSTPIATGIYITRYQGPDVIGVFGNPSDISATSSGGNPPINFTFLDPYPNPSNSQFVMNFSIPKQTNVDLWIVPARWIEDKDSDVSNIGGAIVSSSHRIAERELLRNRTSSAGYYQIQWDGRNQRGELSPGGFYRIYIRSNSVTYWHDVFLYREGLTNIPAEIIQYLGF